MEEVFSGEIPCVDLVGEMSLALLKEKLEFVGEMVASREKECVGDGEWALIGERERLYDAE